MGSHAQLKFSLVAQGQLEEPEAASVMQGLWTVQGPFKGALNRQILALAYLQRQLACFSQDRPYYVGGIIVNSALNTQSVLN